MSTIPKKQWIRDAKVTLRESNNALDFIKTHKLWQGFKSYTWFVKAMLFGGFILSLYLVTSWREVLSEIGEAETAFSVQNMFGAFDMDALSNYTGGSTKYIVLIALEVIIFHFTRRTLMTLTGEKIDTSFGTFINAEKRMILVGLFSWIAESVFVGLSKFGLYILGFSELAVVTTFIVQSFYLGFAIVDNYNEIYKMTIRQSHRYTFQYAPVALIIGAMLNLFIYLPIVGFLIGPIICSVIGTLAMHHITPGISDMAWVFADKKKVKIKKKSA